MDTFSEFLSLSLDPTNRAAPQFYVMHKYSLCVLPHGTSSISIYRLLSTWLQNSSYKIVNYLQVCVWTFIESWIGKDEVTQLNFAKGRRKEKRVCWINRCGRRPEGEREAVPWNWHILHSYILYAWDYSIGGGCGLSNSTPRPFIIAPFPPLLSEQFICMWLGICVAEQTSSGWREALTFCDSSFSVGFPPLPTPPVDRPTTRIESVKYRRAYVYFATSTFYESTSALGGSRTSQPLRRVAEAKLIKW